MGKPYWGFMSFAAIPAGHAGTGRAMANKDDDALVFDQDVPGKRFAAGPVVNLSVL